MRLRHLPATLAAAAVFAGAASASAAIFEPLFMVTKIVGDAEITRPDGRTEPLLVDHAYPYGSRIVVAKALTPEQLAVYKAAKAEPEEPQVSLTMALDFRFRFSAGSDFVLADASADGAEKKVVHLANGSVNTFITAAATKTGGAVDALVEANLAAVEINTPVGHCTRLTQRNQVQVSRDAREGSVYHCQFASQSGVMEISGPQYKLYGFKKNTVVDIDGSADFTSVSAHYGQFTAEFEKGADAVEKAVFRTRCVGKVWREYADVGGRMAVSVMISYPSGKLVTYNYLEGQTGVGFTTSAVEAQGGRNAALGGEDGGESVENELPDDGGYGSDFGTSDFGGSDFGGSDFGGSDFGGDSSGDSGADFDFGDW